MDNETTKIVYERICKLEPEYGLKIVGYVMLNTNEQDMIRLAFSPDCIIQCVINTAKSDLGIPEVPIPYGRVSSSPSSRLFLPHQTFSDFALQNQMQWLSLDSATPVRRSRRREFPVKVCHYFSKGYCKHGNTCRYVHDVVEKEPRVVVLSGRALDKLEIEIVELLKSRGGLPILIAALPMVYRERYGRSLLGDGYLSKTGLSLTRLLALLSRIRVLDGPHGKNSIILTDDSPKRNEISEQSERGICWCSAEMEEFCLSTEQPHDFPDSWTDHHDDSTEGFSEPDTPFASHVQ
ncbi:zinc finger CCCH domain-containing protein 18-like [Cucurbita pepo subsp. pepo]|uniref:zinc finger CCCH domain-containing protein 18-like n=1 Tax=Cucurbita pepo subsp. pepo TaxID=3664 RepID=UPI000C9D71E1|nr:zinc finger CCCH domain-containing protein 18-like [Cucurbita pepo subsp. pepo]